MKEGKELIDLVGRLRKKLVSDRDMGLDSPFISAEALYYLEAGPCADLINSGEALPYRSMNELREVVENCSLCRLSDNRKNVVFGEGPSRARLVFIGEGPGVEEDISGRPFVGEAGKLLDRIIKSMGLTREDVFICNIVKCHPPKNRDPELDEIESCLPFLRAQLSLIKPEVICTLGRISLQTLINKDLKISRDRGRWMDFMGIPVMPTFHPAYLLRNPQAKRYTWEDVKKIMKRLGLEDPRRFKD